MKKIFIFIAMIFALVSCNNEKTLVSLEENDSKTSDKLEITTSIIPLASIANYIGWDYVEATSLVPVWVSAHGFDLKASQMVDIEKSDLIVYLGLEHIDWFLDKAIADKNVLIASYGIELIEWSEDHEHEGEDEMDNEHDEHEDEEDHEEEHEHDEHESDPHVWTSAFNALVIAKNIENKLIELNPENKDIFETNYKNFETELSSVKQSFFDSILDKTQDEFVVFHDAYNYLFNELNIDSSKKLVFRTSVLSDPSSAEMKELIDEITENWVKVIFKEPQFNDSNLQKLASEYNLIIDSLNPLGSDSSKDGYIQNYKDNLVKLEKIYE